MSGGPEEISRINKLSGVDLINDDYYAIIPEKLENLSLHFGKGNFPDVYVINARTFNIYYLKGVEYNGAKYYSLP